MTAQLAMQAASDPLLGFTSIGPYHYYVRQYRNMKGTVEPVPLEADDLAAYGALCGAALARAHARTGSATFISAYLATANIADRQGDRRLRGALRRPGRRRSRRLQGSLRR